jgi:lysophospholipase L1-like esterase
MKCTLKKLWYNIQYWPWRMFVSTDVWPTQKGPPFSNGKSTFTDRTQLEGARNVFVGDSITYLACWSEAFPNAVTANFGVAGDTTQKIFERINVLQRFNPDRIFLRTGINDLQTNMIPCEYEPIYRKLVLTLRDFCPNSKIILMSVLPVGIEFKKLRFRIAERITDYNTFIGCFAAQNGFQYVYDYAAIARHGVPNDWACDRYLNDGIHPSVIGYAEIFRRCEGFIVD